MIAKSLMRLGVETKPQPEIVNNKKSKREKN
jgi:hypothetical protein